MFLKELVTQIFQSDQSPHLTLKCNTNEFIQHLLFLCGVDQETPCGFSQFIAQFLPSWLMNSKQYRDIVATRLTSIKISIRKWSMNNCKRLLQEVQKDLSNQNGLYYSLIVEWIFWFQKQLKNLKSKHQVDRYCQIKKFFYNHLKQLSIFIGQSVKYLYQLPIEIYYKKQKHITRKKSELIINKELMYIIKSTITKHANFKSLYGILILQLNHKTEEVKLQHILQKINNSTNCYFKTKQYLNQLILQTDIHEKLALIRKIRIQAGRQSIKFWPKQKIGEQLVGQIMVYLININKCPISGIADFIEVVLYQGDDILNEKDVTIDIQNVIKYYFRGQNDLKPQHFMLFRESSKKKLIIT